MSAATSCCSTRLRSARPRRDRPGCPVAANGASIGPFAPEAAMNAPEPMKSPLRAPSHLMTSGDYRDSLRRLHPVVYVDGRRVESVADEPAFVPGVQALGVSYDYALDPALAPLMLALQNGKAVPRMLAVDASAGDL